ncbi:hypothetical protein FEM48_Zijuj04G0185800 [Ziziphus jujuba var. spinosa]|uniref:Uncharacterized protein n=1 Tax=Ziziphus jujuba var. spinosa TaxID=714518 RepID=A0A978VLH9_ZIZJJ|nr:hypothetical protein FEM48_Zijuj04G0185800 [Ziziphus jujuba var. spinosa]
MDGYRDCSDGFSCGNITDVEYPFSGEDSQQVTIRYDCLSTSIPFIPPGLPSASAYRVSHLNRPSGSTYKSAFITTESQAAMLCNWTIRVGILRSYVNGDMGNQSKMEEAMRQGFTVKSKVDTGACRECTVSGSRVGKLRLTRKKPEPKKLELGL